MRLGAARRTLTMPPTPIRRIYLASRSARRREILTQMGVRFEMLLLREGVARGSDFDETPLPGENPVDYVLRVARLKAKVGSIRMNQRRLQTLPILAADTTVTLDGEIIGKPTGREDAMHILRRLSDKEHEVHTAVAVQLEHRVEVTLSSSKISFIPLTESVIRNYVATGEPLDKAGAYGLQGKAALFVRNLSGSHSGVVGLPIFETGELLARFGLELP